VGEISFWYRPTRVVPDQRPLNGRRRRCLSYSDQFLSCQQSTEIYFWLLLLRKRIPPLPFCPTVSSLCLLLIGCIACMHAAYHYRTSTISVSVCMCVCVSLCWSQLLAVPKLLNQSRCRLGCGLGCAQETMYYEGSQIPLGEG